MCSSSQTCLQKVGATHTCRTASARRLAADLPVKGHSPLAQLQWNRVGSHGGTPTQLMREKCSPYSNPATRTSGH